MLGDRIAELQLPAMCDEGSGRGWEALSEDIYAPPAGIEVEVVRAWLRNTIEDMLLDQQG